MSTPSSLRSVVVTLTGVVVLAGCGSDGDPEATGADRPTGRAESTDPAGAATPRSDKTEVAPTDLADFSCVRQPNGRWKAHGDVTNSAGQAMVYTVTVVTTDAESRVLGERVTSFELEPEQAREFTWSQFYRGDADDCMPHVQREPA